MRNQDIELLEKIYMELTDKSLARELLDLIKRVRVSQEKNRMRCAKRNRVKRAEDPTYGRGEVSKKRIQGSADRFEYTYFVNNKKESYSLFMHYLTKSCLYKIMFSTDDEVKSFDLELTQEEAQKQAILDAYDLLKDLKDSGCTITLNKISFRCERKNQ